MVTQAIRMNIEPVISSELSAAIIQELQVADLSEANKVIIEDLRFALANFVTGNIIAANNFLFKVRKVIIDNVGSYPEFEASAIYTAYQSQTSSYSVDHSIGNFGAL